MFVGIGVRFQDTCQEVPLDNLALSFRINRPHIVQWHSFSPRMQPERIQATPSLCLLNQHALARSLQLFSCLVCIHSLEIAACRGRGVVSSTIVVRVLIGVVATAGIDGSTGEGTSSLGGHGHLVVLFPKRRGEAVAAVSCLRGGEEVDDERPDNCEGLVSETYSWEGRVYRKCKSMTIKCKRDNNRYGLQMQGTRNIRTKVNEHLPH